MVDDVLFFGVRGDCVQPVGWYCAHVVGCDAVGFGQRVHAG